MPYSRIFILCFSLILPQLSVADTFSIQLGSNSSRFIYATEAFGGTYGPMDLDIGYFFDEDDNTALHMGLLVHNDSLDNPVVISIGLRGFYLEAGNRVGETRADVAALAIGGHLRITPQNFAGLTIGLHYYVAPSIVTFLDGDGATEYGIRLDYAITEQASIYIGYQNIEANTSAGVDLEVDSSMFFGVELSF